MVDRPVTVRDVLQRLDLGALAAALRAWAAERLPDQELLAIDAKAIRSTVTGHDSAAQDFAALVSAYGAESGLVAAVRPYRNGHASEVGTTQALIADLADSLDLTGDDPVLLSGGVRVPLSSVTGVSQT